jgi:hypothetical protein
MNIINLIPDIIKISFKKESYINNLIICSDLNDIYQYENVKKICYISSSLNISISNFVITNIEKVYGFDYNMIFLTSTLDDYIDKEDITFIIAGYESPIINESRIVCYSYGKIIQSTVDQHTEKDKENLQNAEKNKYQTHRNMYNQMYNIYRVLDQVETKYCIKNRSDEYFVDMDEYIEIMKNNNKLITNNLFFLGHQYYISDHLFGTNTLDFKKMIINLKDILENKKKIDQRFFSHTEKVFGVAYLYDKYTSMELLSNENDILKNNFYVYGCNRFHDYLVTTMNVSISSQRINTKYQTAPIIIQKKYRVFVKKHTGYTDVDKIEGNNDKLIDEVRNRIMTIKGIEDVIY